MSQLNLTRYKHFSTILGSPEIAILGAHKSSSPVHLVVIRRIPSLLFWCKRNKPSLQDRAYRRLPQSGIYIALSCVRAQCAQPTHFKIGKIYMGDVMAMCMRSRTKGQENNTETGKFRIFPSALQCGPCGHRTALPTDIRLCDAFVSQRRKLTGEEIRFLRETIRFGRENVADILDIS